MTEKKETGSGSNPEPKGQNVPALVTNLQEMGGFSCMGLSLFLKLMYTEDDIENFELMLTTAEQLAEDLNGELHDEMRFPLTQLGIMTYRTHIQNEHRRIHQEKSGEITSATE